MITKISIAEPRFINHIFLFLANINRTKKKTSKGEKGHGMHTV